MITTDYNHVKIINLTYMSSSRSNLNVRPLPDVVGVVFLIVIVAPEASG